MLYLLCDILQRLRPTFGIQNRILDFVKENKFNLKKYTIKGSDGTDSATVVKDDVKVFAGKGT